MVQQTSRTLLNLSNQLHADSANDPVFEKKALNKSKENFKKSEKKDGFQSKHKSTSFATNINQPTVPTFQQILAAQQPSTRQPSNTLSVSLTMNKSILSIFPLQRLALRIHIRSSRHKYAMRAYVFTVVETEEKTLADCRNRNLVRQSSKK